MKYGEFSSLLMTKTSIRLLGGFSDFFRIQRCINYVSNYNLCDPVICSARDSRGLDCSSCYV